MNYEIKRFTIYNYLNISNMKIRLAGGNFGHVSLNYIYLIYLLLTLLKVEKIQILKLYIIDIMTIVI